MALVRKGTFDFLVVLGTIALAVPLSIYLKANFLTSTLFFFGLPSLYLLVRQKTQWKRIFTAAVLFGLLFGFLLDYLAELNNAWSWSGTDQLVFSQRILGVVNIDVMAWFFLWVFFLVIFYEHFLEHDRKDTISPNYKYALFLGLIVLAIIIATNVIRPTLLIFPYAYFVLGLLTLPPFVYVVSKKPVLLQKFLKAVLFFTSVYLVYEITAFNLGQWRFPGEYIGMVRFGNVAFPFEELIFWIVLSSPIVLSYYELFVDDFK